MLWEGSDGGRSPFYFTVDMGGELFVEELLTLISRSTFLKPALFRIFRICVLMLKSGNGSLFLWDVGRFT